MRRPLLVAVISCLLAFGYGLAKNKVVKQSLAFAAKLEVMKGHDHWYYNLGEKINESAWEFLSQHSLPSDPTYRKHEFR